MSTLNTCPCGQQTKGKYCSRRCYGDSKVVKRGTFTCTFCSKTSENDRYGQRKFCSMSCMRLSKRASLKPKGPDMRGKAPPPSNHPWRQYKVKLHEVA